MSIILTLAGSTFLRKNIMAKDKQLENLETLINKNHQELKNLEKLLKSIEGLDISSLNKSGGVRPNNDIPTSQSSVSSNQSSIRKAVEGMMANKLRDNEKQMFLLYHYDKGGVSVGGIQNIEEAFITEADEIFPEGFDNARKYGKEGQMSANTSFTIQYFKKYILRHIEQLHLRQGEIAQLKKDKTAYENKTKSDIRNELENEYEDKLKTQLNDMQIAHDQKIGDLKDKMAAIRGQAADDAITYQDNHPTKFADRILKNLLDSNCKTIKSVYKNSFKKKIDGYLYSALKLISDCLDPSSLFYRKEKAVFDHQRESSIAQMISFYLLKSMSSNEITYEEFSGIIKDYNKIDALQYKIICLEAGDSLTHASAAQYIETTSGAEIGIDEVEYIEYKNYITMPIEDKNIKFDQGNSKKALLSN